MLAARSLINPGAVVILHDAFREYYHCAMSTYESSQFVGDELWVGAASDGDLSLVLNDCEGAL
ncbi:hypothetical protein CAI21_13580 [Alkalilimnicola ehrlichii]|nr:hypothetical protein CAI21_13580 [Alkalilimnicola ehrlichii]